MIASVARCNLRDELAKAELGDARRSHRLGRLASRLCERPQASIPGACRGWAETLAAYRLLKTPEVGTDEILLPHRQASINRASTTRDLLLLQDSTELDYRGHKALEGAGPLADGRKGFMAHTRLIVAEEEGVILGLEGSRMWARCEERLSKTCPAKKRALDAKESHRWIEGYRRSCELLEDLPSHCRLTMVADRECDIYEVFVAREEAKLRRAEFLVRASQNRALAGGGRLFETCRQASVLGHYEFPVREAETNPKIKKNRKRVVRKGRKAHMELRACRVTLRPPWRKGSQKLEPIEVSVICAREQAPPEGQRPVEWILMTSHPVENFEQARRFLRMYSLRWLCEEFHYVLKSGCRIQELALRDSAAMLAAVALYMVIAWRILYLRDFARAQPDLPGEDFFEPAEWEAAEILLALKRSKRAPPLGKIVIMIARLGGHLGRANDGAPGTKVLWMGLTRLSDAVYYQKLLNDAGGL